MKNLNLLWKNLLNDESGQDLIEYALVASFIALLAVAAFGPLAAAVENLYTTVAGNITNAGATLPTGN